MPKIPIKPDPRRDPLEICPFAKHKDKSWEDVLEEDREYIEWLVGGQGPDMNSRLYDRLMELLEDD